MNWNRRRRLRKQLGIDTMENAIAGYARHAELNAEVKRLEWIIDHPPKFKTGDRVYLNYGPEPYIISHVHKGVEDSSRWSMKNDYTVTDGADSFTYTEKDLLTKPKQS